ATFTTCSSQIDLSGLADGDHTFAVRATDQAGNTGDAGLIAWTVDTIAPDTTIDCGPDALGPATDAHFTFSTNEAATLACKLDDVDLGLEDTGLAPYTASWDTTAASNGPHKVTVATRDKAGNITTASIGVTVSNDQSTTTTPGLIAVGPGYVDATARQVVRTSDDRAYLIAADDTSFQTHTGP